MWLAKSPGRVNQNSKLMAKRAGLLKEMIRKKAVKVILGMLIVAVLFAAVLSNIGLKWQEVANKPLVFADDFLLWLAISMILTVGSFMVHGASWVWILNILSGSVSYRRGLRIFFLSQLGRYIPGKIWTFMGRFMVCQNSAVSRPTVSESILYELMMSITGACVVLALTSAISGGRIGHSVQWLQYLIMAAVACFLVRPSFFISMLNSLLKKTTIGQIRSAIRSVDLLKYLCMHIMVWILMGYGFFCLTSSFLHLPATMSVYFPALFCLAWLGGFFSILTPGGLGVREGILTYLLAQFVSAPDALVIALFSRLWITAAEIVSMGLALGFSYVYPKERYATKLNR